MLTEIRDRSSGWFAWIIAALIIIPMAFWGVNEYASTEAQPVLVEFGDQKIYQQAFQQQLANQQQRAVQSNPSLANSDIFSSDFYKRGVLKNMVDRALIQHLAVEQNYQIGDEQLAARIKDDPIFQTDGKFDPSLYENYLNSSGLFSRQQFENNMRENSRVSQVASGFQESALVLPNEVRTMLEIQAEQRSFDLITVNKADFNDKVEVSDADIKAYYTENTANYMEPDRRSVEYIEFDRASFAEEQEVTEEEIQAAYDSYVAGFAADETRSTRHILLSTGADKSAGDQLDKANELVAQLRAGADFAELAKQHSDDPGSAANGGSLGDVERGVMVAEFEEATFAAEVGAISEPVKTQFGYHIIQVENVNATEPVSFDEMRIELAEEEKLRKAENIALEKAEEIRNELFEQPSSLEGAATLLGAEIKTSSLFTAESGSGISANPAVRAAAFSDQVAGENLNSELLELGNGLYVALRQKEFVASAPKELANVSAQIKSTLIAERASKAAEEAGAELLKRAETNWGDLSSDSSVEVKSFIVSMIDTERKVSPDVMREVLKMQKDDSAALTSFSSTNGDFNIVRLTKVEAGDLTKVSQQVKDSTLRMLEQRNGQSLFSAYLKSVEDSIQPKINEDLL